MHAPFIFRFEDGYKAVGFLVQPQPHAYEKMVELPGEDCCALYPPRSTWVRVGFRLVHFVFGNGKGSCAYLPVSPLDAVILPEEIEGLMEFLANE